MTRHPMAHRLSDELPPPRPTAEPIVTSWREAGIIVVQAGIVAAFLWAFLVVLLAWAA